jgi:predicted tellurium resistance membrane protein TerC
MVIKTLRIILALSALVSAAFFLSAVVHPEPGLRHVLGALGAIGVSLAVTGLVQLEAD